LAALDPQQCHIIELRFFGGLSIEETAEVVRDFSTQREAAMGDRARLAIP